MKYTTEELNLAEDFINNHLERIIEWSIGDIKRCCRMNKKGICGNKGALVGAFILWCCALDYFGGLYTCLTSPGATKSRYKAFIEKYMPRYDADKLVDLRWALLHYYSVRYFLLYHQNDVDQNQHIHLTQSSGGIMLHLGTAILDLENAVKQYCNDLNIHPTLKIKLWRYNKEQYPLMPIKVEMLFQPNTFSSLATGTTIHNIDASGTSSFVTWFKK